jgi:hypothetical protein
VDFGAAGWQLVLAVKVLRWDVGVDGFHGGDGVEVMVMR